MAPVTEHILGYQWWVEYQPVSAGLDSRSGSEEDFWHMVATCRDAGVEVIVDILMNHMAGPCREATKGGAAEGFRTAVESVLIIFCYAFARRGSVRSRLAQEATCRALAGVAAALATDPDQHITVFFLFLSSSPFRT